ncbi:MAG TPA: hypothetical protein VKA43_08495 [Gammaproteobacteria bacterium]|nr:hypothetical protein [Gammaproteobacteria bacterium]
MLKLTVGVLAVVLAGSASAAGWRSLRIDASSEDSFNESVVALQDQLPRVRRHVFEESLKDIWAEGTKAAEADAREYTISDYLRQVDGLGYKEVVTFTDPTGATAKRYWNQAYTRLYAGTARSGQGDTGYRGPPARGVVTYSGSKTLDAGQAYRADGRIGGNHH